MDDFEFTKKSVELYREGGACPNCGDHLLERKQIQRNKEQAERKVECSSCGLVFYSTYKFSKLVFDGWLFGGKIDGRKDIHSEGNDQVNGKRGRSDGTSGQPVNKPKRSRVGSKRGSKGSKNNRVGNKKPKKKESSK